MAAEMAHIFLTDADAMLPQASAERADYFAVLVARGRAGDEIAFERIMLATEQRVVSIAWRMLGNRDDARDAAQDVYLRVFKSLARFRAGEDFRAWLYRITINVCHDFARKKGVSGLAQLDQIDFVQEGATLETRRPGADPESLALHEQQLALIRSALQSLPPKERAALVFRDLEGVSTEQAAHALGARPATGA